MLERDGILFRLIVASFLASEHVYKTHKNEKKTQKRIKVY